MLETTEILNRLLTLCNEQSSGTLFLTTTDNKACHIIYEQGQIEAMAFGAIKGIDVARVLTRLQIERTHFNNTLRMPLNARANIVNQADIFTALGLRRQLKGTSPKSITPGKSQRIYRGHLLIEQQQVDSFPITNPSIFDVSNEKSPKKTKSKRIYRGQVIED